MPDKVIHTIQLAMLFLTALILIMFANRHIDPNVVFTSMIAGVAAVIGGRIGANNYPAKKEPNKNETVS